MRLFALVGSLAVLSACGGSATKSQGSASALPLVCDSTARIDHAVSDGTNVYYLTSVYNRMTPALHRVPREGGEAVQLAEFSNDSGPNGIALAGDYVYVALKFTRTITRVPKAGGTLTTFVDDADMPTAIAADGQGVYWTSQKMMGGGTLTKRAFDGSTSEVVATESVETPLYVTLSDNGVYWWTNEGIRRATKSAGSPIIDVPGSQDAGFLVGTADGVIFTTDSGIYRYDASSNQVALLAQFEMPWSLAWDGATLFFLQPGAVMKLSGPAEPVKLYGEPSFAFNRISVDDSYLYAFAPGGPNNCLMRIAK